MKKPPILLIVTVALALVGIALCACALLLNTARAPLLIAGVACIIGANLCNIIHLLTLNRRNRR